MIQLVACCVFKVLCLNHARIFRRQLLEITVRVLPTIPQHLPTVDQIDIRDLRPSDPTTEKGALTWNYPLGQINGGSLATLVRTPHHEVGGHWHEAVPNKDPERFILLSGTMVFTFEDAGGTRRVERLETTMLGRKILLTIPPFIMHWVKVESDVALFQEVQQEPFQLTDNWSPADWTRFTNAAATSKAKP